MDTQKLINTFVAGHKNGVILLKDIRTALDVSHSRLRDNGIHRADRHQCVDLLTGQANRVKEDLNGISFEGWQRSITDASGEHDCDIIRLVSPEVYAKELADAEEKKLSGTKGMIDKALGKAMRASYAT